MTDKDKNLKVLVVDDSAFMRRVIEDILKTDDNIKSIEFARNGRDCIQKAAKFRPDIITLDLEMPIMNGIQALDELMKMKPTPKVLMISSLTFNGGKSTIEALEHGALDFIAKPTGSIVNFNIESIKKELLKKINNFYNCKHYKSLDINKTIKHDTKITQKPLKSDGKLKYMVAIGTSTGGPRALQEVLPLLPEDIPAGILIVQHMPAGFTKSLADRLDGLSKISVKEAENGDIIKAGCAYIAPGDYHINIKRTNLGEYSIITNQQPLVTGHRPSVNSMMTSVAESGFKDIIAVMMTGMGNDGSEGISKIKKIGGKTIAQNEETCIVYGMPKSAVNIGVIDSVVPLQEIAKEIIRFMGV